MRAESEKRWPRLTNQGPPLPTKPATSQVTDTPKDTGGGRQGATPEASTNKSAVAKAAPTRSCVETLDRDRCQGKILSAHRPRQAAYARKMEPDPEETADFSAFSKMRRIQLDPESVIGRELLDRFAEFDESFTGHSRIWAVVVKLIGLTAMCSKAVIDLEKQVIELRREVRDKA